MKQTKYFETLEDFNVYYPNGVVPSKVIAVIGDYDRIYTSTNNIDGEFINVNVLDGIVPAGDLDITANGDDINVATYAYVNVNVPAPEGYIQPSGNLEITENGEAINVATYASVDVDVPIPSGYIQPSGNLEITENGEAINVATYASVDVDVPIPSGYIQPSGTKSIIENGTGIDITTYAYVDIAVPASGITPTGTYNITSNGTYDVTTYASAYVNVAGGESDVELVWQDSAVASDYNNYNCFKGIEVGKTYAIKMTQAGDFFQCYGLAGYNGSSWEPLGPIYMDPGSGESATAETAFNIQVDKIYYFTVPTSFYNGSTLSSYTNLMFNFYDATFEVAEVPETPVIPAGELVWQNSAVASDWNDNHMFKGLEAGKTYAIKVASVGEPNGLYLYRLSNGSWDSLSEFTSTKLVSNTPYYYTIPVAFTASGSTFSLEGMDLAFVLVDYTQGPVAFQVAEVSF